MMQYYTTNTSGTDNTKEYIMLHHTATGNGSLPGVINWFIDGPVSCHYIVDVDGSVHRFNTDDDVLRHAGVSSRDDRTGLNRYSIGIEVIGPLPGFTDAQRKSVRKLVLDLMRKYSIAHDHIIRHKDVAPIRKVDIDDSFWEGQYTTYQAYQQSYLDIQMVSGLYEQLFKQEFANTIEEGSTIIRNIEAAEAEIINIDGTFNLKEYIYLSMIGVERTQREALLFSLSTMGTYEAIYKKEFADLIANETTIIKDIDGAVDNCTNPDGTLNVRELLYFINIAIERVRRTIPQV